MKKSLSTTTNARRKLGDTFFAISWVGLYPFIGAAFGATDCTSHLGTHFRMHFNDWMRWDVPKDVIENWGGFVRSRSSRFQGKVKYDNDVLNFRILRAAYYFSRVEGLRGFLDFDVVQKDFGIEVSYHEVIVWESLLEEVMEKIPC